MADELAELFSILGDPTRLRILNLLDAGESPVCELAEKLGMSQSAVSHQLRLLRAFHLVENRRSGRHVIYTLGDRCVRELLGAGRAHLGHPTGLQEKGLEATGS